MLLNHKRNAIHYRLMNGIFYNFVISILNTLSYEEMAENIADSLPCHKCGFVCLHFDDWFTVTLAFGICNILDSYLLRNGTLFCTLQEVYMQCFKQVVCFVLGIAFSNRWSNYIPNL